MFILDLLKLGAIYFSLGNIDPALRSRLDSIYLVALFQTDLLERYSFDAILKPFMSDLKKLSAVGCHAHILSNKFNDVIMNLKPGGYTMIIQDSTYNVEGALVASVGDTPAVNMAGGFKEGVGAAMRKCRHCLATNSQIQIKVQLNKMLS